MLSTYQRKRYYDYRAEGYSAARAVRAAKSDDTREDLDWESGRGDVIKRATVKQDGYTCFVNVRCDEDADHGYLGEFSDTPEDGAVKHSKGGYGEYRYFNPANVTEFDRFDVYQRELGLARHDLRLHILHDGDARRDYELALNIESYWVEVKAQRAGVVLGRASLSGIDIDGRKGDNGYISQCARELIEEAIADAEANTPAMIADLRSTADKLTVRA